MNHGKLLQYTVLAQDGLNASSLNWVKYNSYSFVTVVYGDALLGDFKGVRSLQSVTLPIRNLYYTENRIWYTTNVPPSLTHYKSFQIVFDGQLYSQNGIKYSNITNVFNLYQRPEFMREYCTYVVQNSFNFIMVPFLALLLLTFMLQTRGVYELLFETLRIVQTLGLLVYSAFPVGAYSFYFLVGCSYCNFDFVPNLYALLVKSDQSVDFASYFLSTPDMDFIRLMGSIIFLGAIVLVVYLICRYLLLLKEERLSFLVSFGIDLMEVKIFHSFWSSLLYIIANYQSSDFGMFIVFAFALIFLVTIIGRRYSIYQ